MSRGRITTLQVGGLLLAGLVAGCSSTLSTSNPGIPAPHGGEIIAFREGDGFVEVVQKPGASSQVTFYILKDMSTPYTPAPSSGTLTLGKNKSIPLKAEGDGLVTPSGTPVFKAGAIDGVLTVDLDGKPRAISLEPR